MTPIVAATLTMSDQQQPPLYPDGSNGNRMLACVRCQRSKIKCDRSIPCNSCVRRNVQCVPGTAIAPKQRRKRFPERELLDRLHRYENLLREHDINFDPLHKTSPQNYASSSRNVPRHAGLSESESSGDDVLAGKQRTRPNFDAKSYWDVMINTQLQQPDDSDDSSADEVSLQRKVSDMWSEQHQEYGFLLPFGQPKVRTDLSSRHPDQATIFKLWQVYIDNVNPLLKITHIPTLQGRVVTAATNISAAGPALTALLFSIYCVSVLSLRELECQQLLGSTRQALLTDFQLSCQQALANCGVLKTTDRECLAAFFLYIVSVEPSMDPYSINSLLGIAVRISYRMGLHSNTSYAKLQPLEAELRRRLWWALILFDTRIGEMSGLGATLVPTWDCETPHNLNDFELQPDMQDLPKPQSTISEAIFVKVRSEMGDHLRHASFFLDFVNPAYKLIVQKHPKYASIQGSILDVLDQTLEDEYLQRCNPENSVHFIAIWLTRELMAKNRLLHHYSSTIRSPESITDATRDKAAEAALRVLECDSKLMRNTQIRGFQWYLFCYFPFVAHFHLLQDTRQRPLSAVNSRAWRAMSDNYETRFLFKTDEYDNMFKFFGKIALSSWRACENAYIAANIPYTTPTMIKHIETKLNLLSQVDGRLPEQAMRLNLDSSSDNWMPLSTAGRAPWAHTDTFDFDPATFAADVDANGQSLFSMIMEGMDWSMPEFQNSDPQAVSYQAQ